jgi:hypothetical protein
MPHKKFIFVSEILNKNVISMMLLMIIIFCFLQSNFAGPGVTAHSPPLAVGGWGSISVGIRVESCNELTNVENSYTVLKQKKTYLYNTVACLVCVRPE